MWGLLNDYWYSDCFLLELFFASRTDYLGFDPDNRSIGLCIRNNDDIFRLKAPFAKAVERDFDLAGFPGRDGLFRVRGNRTTAGCAHISDDQVGFACIFEFETIGNRFPFDQLAEIMDLFFEFDHREDSGIRCSVCCIGVIHHIAGDIFTVA